MIKKLLICASFFLSSAAIAQKNAPVLKEFYDGATSYPGSFKLDDNVNIMQVANGNNGFDMVAVDEQMKVLWDTPLKGNGLGAAKYKDKIIVVAINGDLGSSSVKGYFLDPKTGKVGFEKIMYDANSDYMAIPYLLTDGKSYLKLFIRQNGKKKKFQITIDALKDYNITKEMDVVEFDDQLNSVKTFKPEVPLGIFINLCANQQGDFFTEWFNSSHIDVIKYTAGSNVSSGKISAEVSFRPNDNLLPAEYVHIAPSMVKRNVVFCSLMFKNANNDMELAVGKLDFSTGKSNFVNEVFTNEHCKSLRKAFVPINKKMDDLYLGNSTGLGVRYCMEAGDKLVVAISERNSKITSNGVWDAEGSILLNVYDADLNLKSQPIFPVSYTVPTRNLPIGYHYENSKLYILSNYKPGLVDLNAAYGVFNLNNGTWEKMEILSKSDLKNSSIALGQSALWFGSKFILPYIQYKGLFKALTTQPKMDISLQQNDL